MAIGNQQLIERRRFHPMRCELGGTLGDYVPFYFTSHSPMFLNIKTGHRGIQQFPNEDVAILVSSLHLLKKNNVPFVFTDRHAVLATCQIFTELKDLDKIAWDILAARRFARDPEDPTKFEKYEAETLIHKHVPISSLLGIACFNQTAKTIIDRYVNDSMVSVNTAVKSDWYF